ncbi:MAG: LPS export ABC transporter periplasmic protein LptC [Burkholderiaceae bacterium]|nr:LPS export ABC transporter periplasmic protein LptC [Burkholderiaceae bacterium]
MPVVARLRGAWERASVYLPIILMGILALGTYWLASNTPIFSSPEVTKSSRHDPDYFMRNFEVKTFDATGRLKSEVIGLDGRHYPDTDTLEIDKARIRSFTEDGRLTTATADRAVSNSDGSEVQLYGHAIVVREAAVDRAGNPIARFEVRGEFLHAFLDTERIKSHLPVVLTRGTDEFAGDSLDYDNLDRVMNLRGRVKGFLAPRPAK